jgi:hypothetical protein
MALDLDTLLALVSDGTGDKHAAAEALGIQAKAIRLWRTDEEGRVVSRRVTDAVIAAMVRQRWALMKQRKRPEPLPVEVIDELLSLEGLKGIEADK